MATGNRNGKSAKISARIPLELVDKITLVIHVGESQTAFIIKALEREVERRKEDEQKGDKNILSG